MSTSPENIENSSSSLSPGFNVAPATRDPMGDFNMLKNWAPKAMEAIRQSNLKTQMANPVEDDQKKSSAKGLISGFLN